MLGGGAVRFPIDAGGALKDVIEAPSLDFVRPTDARTNIGFAVEAAAGADSEPDVHEDYVSAYDLVGEVLVVGPAHQVVLTSSDNLRRRPRSRLNGRNDDHHGAARS